MKRVCYNCTKELNLEEAADGQQALEETVKASPMFEGWVHCKGPWEQFIQEGDKALKEAVERLRATFFPDSIQICRKCVEEKCQVEYSDDEDAIDRSDLKRLKERRELQTIEIDCPPGNPRPGDLIAGVIEGTGLEIRRPASVMFGNWVWDYNDIDPKEWNRIQPTLKERLKKLFKIGVARYVSW